MFKMLWNLPKRNTDALIGGVANELAKVGIELIDSTYFIKDQLAGEGVLTKRKPNDAEAANIEYGLHIAGEIARLDLGQTIVIRASACVAIEAMEGTDETIRRAGRLVNGRLTVVKVAKPHQDMRFDVPVVGVSTIEALIEAGATCLSITAGKTLLFDRVDKSVSDIKRGSKRRIRVGARGHHRRYAESSTKSRFAGSWKSEFGT
jgi:hypothetical protein